MSAAACSAVLFGAFVFGTQAAHGAVAYVPDNGVLLTPYYAITNSNDPGLQSSSGLEFSLDYIHIQKNEWASGGANVALDVSVVVSSSGIGVFFSATASASSPGIAGGTYEIDFGIRITNNQALAFDTLVIGGGISEFRPSLLPNGASVDDAADAAAQFSSSIAGPYQDGGVDEAGRPLHDRYVAEKACATQDPQQDVGPIFRNGNGNGNGVHCSVITPDATEVMLYILNFLPGDSIVLDYTSRLYVEVVRVPAPAGVWVMLLGLAAMIPLRLRADRRRPAVPRAA